MTTERQQEAIAHHAYDNTGISMETDIENKRQFPDEVLDGIIAKAHELADKTPVDAFAGMTEEQIRVHWECVHNLMIIGADVALDYMDRKLKSLEQNN